MSGPRHILLMTSTIAPSDDVFLLSVNKADQRLAQYKSSLKFYAQMVLSGAIDRIVYMDNSGHSLKDLVAVAERAGIRDRIEFLSYKQDIPGNNSRYYMEIHLIDQAFRDSPLIAGNPDAIVWKVTGRYVVRNIESIVRSWPPDTDVYIHHRNHPERLVDFYLLGFINRTYHQHIGRDFEDFAGTADGEKILRRKIDTGCFPDVRFTKRFRCTPRLSGVRGHDGKSYDGFEYSVKYAIRAIANAVAPNLWI